LIARKLCYPRAGPVLSNGILANAGTSARGRLLLQVCLAPKAPSHISLGHRLRIWDHIVNKR